MRYINLHFTYLLTYLQTDIMGATTPSDPCDAFPTTFMTVIFSFGSTHNLRGILTFHEPTEEASGFKGDGVDAERK